MKRISLLAISLIAIGVCLPQVAEAQEKYSLRYQFRKGESVRWNVEHRCKVRTSIAGTTKTADTTSVSTKRWTVADVGADGTTTFEYSVDDVNMRQQMTGSQEARYSSKSGHEAPPGFQNVAKSIGKVLSIVKMDARGSIVTREKGPELKAAEAKALAAKGGAAKAAARAAAAAGQAQAQNGSGFMSIPLPEQAVAVGENWTHPVKMMLKTNNDTFRKIRAIQKFTLESVRVGIASIRVRTIILTPIDDPALITQYIQRLSSGTVLFDLETGRIVSQDMSLDERVVGFRGEASSVHYETSFNEKLVFGTLR
jgi:hypothetical protein